MNGRLNSRYIRTKAMAVKIAVLVSLVIMALLEDALVLVEISDIKKQLLPSGLYRRPRNLTVSVPPDDRIDGSCGLILRLLP